jgi:5-(carboxyamino)imidazole ribonucleotide mutase
MEFTELKVGLLMGSDSDLPVAQRAMAVLDELGVPYEARVASAHRTPEKVTAFAASARDNGFGVIIAAAGMAAHLAGAAASHTTLPVIGLPCRGGALDGLDALLATVQMPPGIPVAAVALDGGANAGLLAAEILAVANGRLAGRLAAYRAGMAKAAEGKDAALQKRLEKN